MEDTEPKDKEMDLGEFRGHDMHSMNADNDNGVTESDGEEESPEKEKLTKRQRRAAERNAALLLIVGKSLFTTSSNLTGCRNVLSASAFFCRAQMSGVITFRPSSVFSITRHRFQRRLIQDRSAGVQTKPKRRATASSARRWGAVSIN
jgi:hypothetical protein